MSQEQPSCLPHWRQRQREIGCERALKEASLAVDRLTDELGRKTDRHLALLFGGALWGFICGAGAAALVGWVK